MNRSRPRTVFTSVLIFYNSLFPFFHCANSITSAILLFCYQLTWKFSKVLLLISILNLFSEHPNLTDTFQLSNFIWLTVPTMTLFVLYFLNFFYMLWLVASLLLGSCSFVKFSTWFLHFFLEHSRVLQLQSKNFPKIFKPPFLFC